jgi:energy-coupling factor transport system permease protein
MVFIDGNSGNSLVKGMNPIIKFVLTIIIIVFSIWTNTLTGQVLNLGFLLLMFAVWGLLPGFIRLVPIMLLFLIPVFLISVICGSTLQAAGVSSIRIVFMFLCYVLFCGSTCPSMLTRSLNTVGVSSYVSIGILITLRFIPVLMNEMQKIKDSFDMRLNGQKRGFKVWYRGMIIPFVFRMSSLSDNLSLALHMKGFGTAAPTVYKPVGIKAADLIFLSIISLFMAGVKWIY